MFFSTSFGKIKIKKNYLTYF